MRVAFLTHNFPREAGDVSGAFLLTLARALTERGHRVQVIAPSDRGQAGPPVLEGIPVRRVRYAAAADETLAYRGTMAAAARSPGGAWRTWRLVRALRAAAREALADGADVLHAHWWVPAGLAAPSGAPMVLTLHGTDAAILDRSAIARFVARPVFGRARVVTTVSDAVAEIVQRRTGRPVAQAHRMPMPVDTTRFDRGSLGGGGLLVVARLTAQKRVALVLDALAELEREGGAPPLTIVGDGPEREALEARAAALPAGRVRFLGALAPAEVVGHLGRADLALFPAVGEGFGLAAAEALVAGVPVVACTDGGGVLEVVPATGAGRHASPEAGAIARAIRELLGNPAARVAARELGARWREALSPARAAERCEGWYREALGA